MVAFRVSFVDGFGGRNDSGCHQPRRLYWRWIFHHDVLMAIVTDDARSVYGFNIVERVGNG